jgi:hypothetical protein
MKSKAERNILKYYGENETKQKENISRGRNKASGK